MKANTTLMFFATLAIFASGVDAIAGELVFSKAQICKAGISLVMRKNPSIMKVSVIGDEIRVSYIRSNDGSAWHYKCKVEGRRVIWGADPGRWRTNSADEPMSYWVSDDSTQLTLEEIYQDGSSNRKTFSTSDLQ